MPFQKVSNTASSKKARQDSLIFQKTQTNTSNKCLIYFNKSYRVILSIIHNIQELIGHFNLFNNKKGALINFNNTTTFCGNLWLNIYLSIIFDFNDIVNFYVFRHLKSSIFYIQKIGKLFKNHNTLEVLVPIAYLPCFFKKKK